VGRKSSITQLDPRVREAVDRLVRDGRASIDEIVDAIEGLGGAASRSAVGRYVKSARDQMERYRQAQEVAKVWVGKLEEEPESDVGRLLTEMLRTVAFQTIGQLGDQDEVNPGAVMFLARAIKDMASADKLAAERELKVRQEVTRQAAEHAAKIARKGGMSRETVAEIRREILGMAG
jgi:hypothetical protein